MNENEIPFLFSDGTAIKSNEFFKYELHNMEESNLNKLLSFCIYWLRVQSPNTQEFEALKSMHQRVLQEKDFRLQKFSNEISIRNHEAAKEYNKSSSRLAKITIGIAIVTALASILQAIGAIYCCNCDSKSTQNINTKNSSDNASSEGSTL